MRLGIVVALKDEARPLTRKSLELGQAVELGEQIMLQVSGMGSERARTAGNELIARDATALLSWGTAAALDPTLQPGTLILPHDLVSAEGQSFPTDQDWQESVFASLSSLLNIHRGTICESSMVLDSPAAKADLYAQTGAVAVDMESFALARLAAENALPFLSLRFIVDPADMSLPASLMSSLDADGQVRLMILLGKLLLHPGDVVSLIRLGSAFGKVKKSMRVTIDGLDELMGLPPHRM